MGAFYSISCPVCDAPREREHNTPFAVSFHHPDGIMLGCGLRYPEVCQAIYHDIRKGKYGKEARKAMRWMFRPAIYSQRAIFVCRDCGGWQTGDDIRLCRLRPGRKEAPGSCLDRERQRRVKVNMKALCYLDPKEYDVVWQQKYPCSRCGGETGVEDDLNKLTCRRCGQPMKVMCTGHWD